LLWGQQTEVTKIEFSPQAHVVAASVQLSSFVRSASAMSVAARAALHCRGDTEVRGCTVGRLAQGEKPSCNNCAELDLGLLVLSLKGAVTLGRAVGAARPSRATSSRATVNSGHVLVRLAGFETPKYAQYKVKDGVYRARPSRLEGASGHTQLLVVLHVPHVHALAAVSETNWTTGAITLPAMPRDEGPRGGRGSRGAAKEKGPTVSFMQQEWYTQNAPLPPSKSDDGKQDDSRSTVVMSVDVAMNSQVCVQGFSLAF
jgi:hypothetical protein